MTQAPSSSSRPFADWKSLLLTCLCAAGMWTYASRVLIPRQKADAASHGRPRGNLSDLYPRWLGARELLLHGRDPYSAEVTRDIQVGYYGRPLDPSHPGDPRDAGGFAYPVYVVFPLAPTIALPFAVVQKCFFWLLLALALATTLLWLRVLRWEPRLEVQVSLLALTLGSLTVMQGLKLEQITLWVAGLIAIAVMLLTTDHPLTAGILLAFATIKPQLVWLLLCWLAIWTIADWRRRYRGAVSFLATMAILLAASEWYLPHWIPRFWRAIHDYQTYTGARSVMDTLIGTPWSRGLELVACAAVAGVCWRERRQAANTKAFTVTLSLVLAVTILVVPSFAAYNQVLLIPAVLVLYHERRGIWRRGIGNRFLAVVTATMVAWPWISSTALAAFSLIFAPQRVARAWAVPFWTVTQTPVVVAALMLVHCYRTTFAPPVSPGSS